MKTNKLKASELRIGNYVNVPNYKQCPFRIDAFEHCSEKFIKVAQEVKLNGFEVHPLTWYGADLEPIPLTEEWLFKFGFEFTNGYGFKIFGNWLQKEDDVYFYNVNGNFIQIDYVHQLQNLYFALTGKELKQQEQ